jgi:hypothetical protein
LTFRNAFLKRACEEDGAVTWDALMTHIAAIEVMEGHQYGNV